MPGIFIAKVKMSSGGHATGKSWSHTFAVSTDLLLGAAGMQAACDQLVTTVFKPFYPSTVYFDSVTISNPEKKGTSADSGDFDVYPVNIQGQRGFDGAGNERMALECCATVNAYAGHKRASKFWLRGALFEGEVSFNPGGGWVYVPQNVSDLNQIAGQIDLTVLTLKPGKFNMVTRDPATYHAFTKLSFGPIRARQTTVHKKRIIVSNEGGALETLKESLPLIGAVAAFILTKGKAGITPAMRLGLSSTIGSIIQFGENAISTLTAPDA